MIRKPDTPDYVMDLAKKMRSEATPAETLLWQYLRRKGLDGHKFYRQYTIGRYIADFCCPSRKLIVELDGDIHDSERNKEYDRIRDLTLKGYGMRIIRFRNEQVIHDIDAVLADIHCCLSEQLDDR